LETDRFATNSPVEVIQDRTTVRLTLNKTLDQVWKTYSRDNREKIKKSQKAGVSVSIQGNLETLMAFSKFYLQRMSELQADDEYFFDEEYFRGIAELGPSAYRVYLAFHEEKFIGGALILLSRRFIHYHLSATPREFQKLGTNNRLRHEVICDFLETDYEQIHFGGGRTTAKDDSLLAFKKKFSSETAPYCVGTCVLNSEVYRHVVETWRQTNHEKVDRFGNRVLCYHY
jgi:lipid II:glycine glycyltransferase (peptidoglycan interpeptide bridge formation enzyme)